MVRLSLWHVQAELQQFEGEAGFGQRENSRSLEETGGRKLEVRVGYVELRCAARSAGEVTRSGTGPTREFAEQRPGFRLDRARHIEVGRTIGIEQ